MFAMGADASHLTGSDPAGVTLRRCLAQVIAGQHIGRHIDLIHAHGTGTQLNDPVELAAIESVVAVQASPPAVYSHKGARPQPCASGLVPVVLNLLMHQFGRIPANINTHDPLATSRVSLPRKPSAGRPSQPRRGRRFWRGGSRGEPRVIIRARSDRSTDLAATELPAASLKHA